MARIVAELGRPETPEETAARKAQSSRNYRASKNFRNLFAAMLVILAVVAVIAFGVPRGNPAQGPRIDVAAEAEELSAAFGRPVLAAEVPDDWYINAARIEGERIDAWTVVYAPDEDRGFLRVAQGFDADDAWTAELLSGAAPDDTVTINGVEWDEYRIDDPDTDENISYALATTAGADRVLIYGSAAAELSRDVAETLAPDILDLRGAAS